MFSIITVLGSFGLIILPLIEILLGAGKHIEHEFQTGQNYGREYRFEYSLTSFRELIVPLVLAVIAQIIAFASLYSFLARYILSSYRIPVLGADAITYSTLVFTSGNAEMGAELPLSRSLIAIESLLSWVISSLVLSTILAWIIQRHQARLENERETTKEEVLRREETFRLAKVGVYGDYDAIVREAKSRIHKKSKKRNIKRNFK